MMKIKIRFRSSPAVTEDGFNEKIEFWSMNQHVVEKYRYCDVLESLE